MADDTSGRDDTALHQDKTFLSGLGLVATGLFALSTDVWDRRHTIKDGLESAFGDIFRDDTPGADENPIYKDKTIIGGLVAYMAGTALLATDVWDRKSEIFNFAKSHAVSTCGVGCGCVTLPTLGCAGTLVALTLGCGGIGSCGGIYGTKTLTDGQAAQHDVVSVRDQEVEINALGKTLYCVEFAQRSGDISPWCRYEGEDQLRPWNEVREELSLGVSSTYDQLKSRLD
jgi:hypothetical protein